MYVKSSVRRGLLAKMLSEILDTRVMVKNSMKAENNDKSFLRIQNNRQLALKYIANVTYGYTSASFSGRMPCAEIADSIVQTGRETLENVFSRLFVLSSQRQSKSFIRSLNGAQKLCMETPTVFLFIYLEEVKMKPLILGKILQPPSRE